MNKSPGRLNYRICELTSSPDKVVGSILRDDPEAFTWEPTIVQYCSDAMLPASRTLVARNWLGENLGCAVGKVVNANTVELLVVAVRRGAKNKGIGTALIASMLRWSADNGRKFVMLRTIGPSQNSPEDTRVFEFFKKCGFVALDEYDSLWSEQMCAVMVQKVE